MSTSLSPFLDMFTPDPALRRPFTNAVFFPYYLSCYAMAVLAILPRTFMFRLSLLPLVLWQAWRCAFGLDYVAGLELSMGVENAERFSQWNFIYPIATIIMALRSVDWAFARKPLRKYEPFAEGQHTPVERPLTALNVLVDAFDLMCNPRGIRWSWGSKSFLRKLPPPPSLAALALKLVFKLAVYDISMSIVRRVCPSLSNPAGGTLFDPQLDPLPRVALAAFLAACCGISVYIIIDVMHHITALIARILLQHHATDWPALSIRPWMATSIADFWSFRWHQCLRHIFIVFGARPVGALFGRPGALLGAFGVSAVLHYIGTWGLGTGTEISSGAFFVLMAVGAVLEQVWQRMTGTQVRGFWGWAWTMAWTFSWGAFMIEGWARHGLVAYDLIPMLGLGNRIIDGIVALITNI